MEKEIIIAATEQKKGLVARALDRIKNTVKKIGHKGKVAFTLVIGIPTVVFFAACTPTPGPGPGPGPGPTDSGYSQVLDNVLSSEYYNGLIDNYSSTTYQNTAYDPHPYGFLQKKSHDVTSIKNGTLDCSSTAYIMDDKFYIRTSVENAASTPYYTDYVITYSLSTEEKEDLDMLYKGGYIQAPFFIQQLSADKTATVVTESNITAEAKVDLNDYFCNKTNITKTALGTDNVEVMIKDYSVDDQYANLYIFVDTNISSTQIKTTKMGVCKIVKRLTAISDTTINGKAVYKAPSVSGALSVTEENASAFNESATTITAYSCQNTTSFSKNLDTTK